MNCVPLPVVFLAAIAMLMAGAAPADRNITVIAHRGNSSHAPENTLAAFRSAIEVKPDYIELDAYASADGTLWVHHDKTLDRTTDIETHLPGKKIELKTVHDAVLAKLDAGSWFDPKFKGEKLPTLAESLDLIQSKSRTLLEHKEGEARAYAELLKSRKLVGRLIVQSFNWEFLADLHRLLPDQKLGALGGKELTLEKTEKLPATGARIVGWDYKELNAKNIKDLHGRGYTVWCYTPDEASDWQRLIDDGIDGIITNRPGELREWLRTGKAPPPASSPRRHADTKKK